MSQTSMRVRQIRGGQTIDEKGFLPEVSLYEEKEYLTTTALLHYYYEDIEKRHYLQEVTIAAIPNGRLQERYNPIPTDSFWLAGRNAPTRGEDFRVRVGFRQLKAKANWRVQTIRYNTAEGKCVGYWEN